MKLAVLGASHGLARERARMAADFLLAQLARPTHFGRTPLLYQPSPLSR